jgi:hypothetical protein
MEIQTYQFIGDSTTYLGAVAVIFTPVLLYWIWRSYWNSPYRK